MLAENRIMLFIFRKIHSLYIHYKIYCPCLFIQTWLFFLYDWPCRFIICLCSSYSFFWFFSHSGDNRNLTLLTLRLEDYQTRKRFKLFPTLWKTESIFHFLSKILKHLPLIIAAQVSYCLTVAFPDVFFPSQ